MSSKSTILSKKEKMIMKRKQKLYPQIIHVEDSHSEERISPQAPKIEKTEAVLPKNTTAAEQLQQPNRFNFERLKKYEPSKYEKPPIILQTEECGGVFDIGQYEGRSLITFKVAGSDNAKYISENHLKKRLNDIEEKEKEHNNEQQTELLEQQKSQQNLAQAQENQQTQKQREKHYRLSHDSDSENDDEPKRKSVKCYRCGEKGHIARNCHLQQKVTCMFCLGRHHHSQCTDKLCFKCNQPGHVSQECKSTGIKCRKCRKLGHVEKQCGAIIMMDYDSTTDKEIRERYFQGDLKRLRCLSNCKNKRGHFNCHDYGPRPQRIYSQSSRGYY